MTLRGTRSSRAAVILAVCLTGPFGTAHADVNSDETIVIRVGEQRSLSAKGVKSYSEGAPGVVDIRVTRDQRRFVLVGRSVGIGSLLLIRQDRSQVQYTIEVIPADGTRGFGGRENIRLDLYFVLIQQRYSHQIGLDWPGNIGSTLTPSEATLAITGGSGVPTQSAFQILPQTFLPSLDVAQAKGWAKLYRQAAIVTANGTEAVFTSGGEFNVQVQNNLTVNVQAIEFGTRITVLPRYDSRTGRIELEITADVSDLDQERGSQGIPGRFTTHVETLVNLDLGQSISLAGIQARTERRRKDGLPGLAMVPFIGALFGSHGREAQSDKSYMLVVPSVVEPVSLAQRNHVDEAIRAYESFRGSVDAYDLLDQPRFPSSRGARSAPP
ncbi:MAG: pilus assembly protein N-terminal domain-containing protein [Myxococcota bacterium]